MIVENVQLFNNKKFYKINEMFNNNNLLFYHNSKWLSKGKVHFCVYKLRNEIIIHSLKKLLQSEMMRYRNEGCFMLISIS